MKTMDAEGAPRMMRYSGMKARPSHRGWLPALFCFFAGFHVPSNAQKPETLGELTARLGRESNLAYEASRFSLLSKDYFARFHRDPAAEPNGNETAIDSTWKIVLSARADPLAELMAGYLVQFLDERMGLGLEIENRDPSQLDQPGRKRILLLDSGGGDPGAVAFDAIEAAKARGANLVIIDTAGRLHTQANLMDELKKIRGVVARQAGDFDQRVLLVIDGTTGQNGLIQARAFTEAVACDGVVLTKLDGTARGGIVLAITGELGLPVLFVGTGESLDDLAVFDPDEFVDALLPEPSQETPD